MPGKVLIRPDPAGARVVRSEISDIGPWRWVAGGVLVVALVCAWFVARRAAPPSKVQTAPTAPHDPEPTHESVTSALAAPLPTASETPSPEARAEALLREVERLAASDKPRALELALSRDRALPAQGVLAEARRAVIVTLLVDTERMAEARARTLAFLEEYPSSRYAPLVQGVTGIHPRPRPSEMLDAR